MNVQNYKCLAALKLNMQCVFIDKNWVVNKYLLMEKKKEWKELDTEDDMNVLNLESELLAESMGVDVTTLPPISVLEDPAIEPMVVAEVIEVDVPTT